MAFLQPDKTLNWNGLKGYQYYIEQHNVNGIAIPTQKRTKTIGITVHNTEAINCASGTTPAEQYTRACRNGNLNDVRVHIFVDEYCFWVGHDLSMVSWHSGDGTSDPNSGNNTTISIEVIGNSSKVEDNAAKVVAYLMKQYGWNIENNLYTHTYWINRGLGIGGTRDNQNTYKSSRAYKYCPCYILPHWSTFKNTIKKYLNNGNSGSTSSTTTDSKKLYRIRKSWDDEKSQIGAYSTLTNAKKAWKDGYFIYDSNGKQVYPESKNDTSTTDELYRVRKSWTDVKSQIGAYKSLESAMKVCKDGYHVYNSKGNEIKANSNSGASGGYYFVDPIAESTGTQTITIRTYDNSWSSEGTNCGNTNSAIRGVAAKSTLPGFRYRVHLSGGNGWLSWISSYDINNWNTGCAGLKSKTIDAIQFDTSSGEYSVSYRVKIVGGDFLPWVKNTEDYAGIFNRNIDKIEVKVVKG